MDKINRIVDPSIIIKLNQKISNKIFEDQTKSHEQTGLLLS